jgi:Arc/MetJ family transcription regulator
MMLPRLTVDLIANAVRCGRLATDQSFVPLAGVLLHSVHWFMGRPHERHTHEHGFVLDDRNVFDEGPDFPQMEPTAALVRTDWSVQGRRIIVPLNDLRYF